MQKSIRTRLTASFILLAILPLLLISFILGRMSFIQQQSQALALQQEVARRVAVQVEGFIAEIEQDLNLIARIQELDMLSEAQFESILTQLPALNHSYETVALLDNTGQALQHVSRVGTASNHPWQASSNADAMQWAWQTGERAIGPVQFDERSSEPMMLIFVPVHDIQSGTIENILVANIRVKPIWELIGAIRVDEGESVYIVDDQQRVIAHRNPSVILRNTHFAIPAESGVNHTGLDNPEVVLAMESLEYGNQTFTVVAERDRAQALSTAVDAMVFAAVFTPTVLIIAIVLGYRNVRRIVGPIELLAETAQAIAAGDLSQQVKVSSQDEIGTLASTFNSMTKQLQRMLEGLEANMAALQAGEERFRQLAENIDEVFWMTDTNGNLIYVSPAYEKIWGRTCKSLYADPRNWIETVHPDDRPALEYASNNKVYTEGYDEQYRIIRPDGSIRWIHDRAFPIRNEAGDIYRITGIADDITERKQAEEALRQSQKLESIGVLAGGIAHDFNNLLTGMIVQSSLALRKLAQPDQARKHIKKGINSAERAADLTRQLLAYAGKGQIQIEQIDLNELIIENSGLFETASAGKVNIQLDLMPDLPFIEADKGQIQQLVMNLIMNATEAIDGEGGQVIVQTRKRPIGKTDSFTDFIDSPVLPAGAYVALQVSDTGKGMDPETLGRIFEPFYSTKGMSRGLGLSATLGIIRQQKGGLRVQSVPGQGTSFLVLLPALKQKGTADKKEVDRFEPVPLAKPAVILVIDDEAFVREAVADCLQTLSVTVITAVNGLDGIERFKKHHHDINLILLDMQMPIMNGEETYRQLKQVDPNVKVILSSGHSETEALRQFQGEGLVAFLQKPYDLQVLAQTVQTVLS